MSAATGVQLLSSRNVTTVGASDFSLACVVLRLYWENMMLRDFIDIEPKEIIRQGTKYIDGNIRQAGTTQVGSQMILLALGWVEVNDCLANTFQRFCLIAEDVPREGRIIFAS